MALKEQMDVVLPDQNNFIHHWVDTLSKEEFIKFKHYLLSELPGSRSKIAKPLAEHIWEHYHDRKLLTKSLEELGYCTLAEVYRDKRPKKRDTRMGNFGEIVTSAYMEQQLGYQVPIYRLRYNPNPEQSMKGDDVIGFKFGVEEGEQRIICVAESKVRKHYDANILNEAYEGIKKSYGQAEPTSLNFIYERLIERGNYDLARKVHSFLNHFSMKKPYSKEYLIFLVSEHRHITPTQNLHNQSNIIEGLSIYEFKLHDIHPFINDLFEQEIEL
ncbi:hypothetical protein JOC37_001424 [Desulfohalotomaculum tongense]|uniref:Hachiman antiphage defense system protein HamA n=1 Tax=Desulforadius tongensis TaxID=1216062 RepID=UPI001958AE4D|nr:Hachiman antiphage defense system protein HamA [Desulforadius tongensis]MBM7855041.1 hypothetical protein [Desulforadius tongensis]